MKPHRLVLPSQRVVRVRIDRAARAPASAERGLFADVLALLASDRMIVEDDRTSVRIDVSALPLRDFHVLRDFARRAKLVRSEPYRFPCDNCDAEIALDESTLPLDDLADRYEDEEPAGETSVGFAAPLRSGARAIRMRPVTVAEARPLWRELGKDRPFEITPKLLGAMGVVRLEPDVRDLRDVAKVLRDADDDAWSLVEATFLSLAYPPRAVTSVSCERCGAVHDLDLPVDRELEPGMYRPMRASDAPFPTPDAFEARARRVADETFRRMNAGGLTLVVVLDTPELDSGGVPMLGSYAPEDRDDGGVDFVVRLYYRTFERAFHDDASFDWEHEVDETIEHEAQHHLYYLSGHDPMDAQERAESERDLVRRVGGAKRYRKLQQRALLAGVWEIVRVLVPLLALVALAVLVLSRCSS